MTTDVERLVICTKCGATSGNDWKQCGGSCPLPDSPHYKATDDVKLLPLHLLEAFSTALKGERGELDAWLEVNNEQEVAAHVEAYARANVAHATAARDAELVELRSAIEALRAEVDRMKDMAMMQAARAAAAERGSERLAEALSHQRWCRTCAEDGWESCEDGRKADALLRPTAATNETHSPTTYPRNSNDP